MIGGFIFLVGVIGVGDIIYTLLFVDPGYLNLDSRNCCLKGRLG